LIGTSRGGPGQAWLLTKATFRPIALRGQLIIIKSACFLRDSLSQGTVEVRRAR
jgi:hypothetical protein